MIASVGRLRRLAFAPSEEAVEDVLVVSALGLVIERFEERRIDSPVLTDPGRRSEDVEDHAVEMRRHLRDESRD